MVDYERTKRLQLLREAEGYLDLVTSCADDLPLQPALRDRLAQRALTVLDSIQMEGPDREDPPVQVLQLPHQEDDRGRRSRFELRFQSIPQ